MIPGWRTKISWDHTDTPKANVIHMRGVFRKTSVFTQQQVFLGFQVLLMDVRISLLPTGRE